MAKAVKKAAKKAVKKVAKKAAPKKAAAPKTSEIVVLQWQSKELDTKAIITRAVEMSGKKTVKELNVYVQPENNMVYFTADGEDGSFEI